MKEVNQVLSRKIRLLKTVNLCVIVLLFASILPISQSYFGYINGSLSGDESFALFHSSGIASFKNQGTIFEAKDIHEYMQQSAGAEEIWKTLFSSDTHPPLFFLLLSVEKHLFDGNLLGSRFISYFFYVLSIFILYIFLRTAQFSHTCTAILFLATSYSVISYSTMIRPNMMATALVSAVYLLIFISIKTENIHRGKNCLLGISIGLCAGAAFLTHYLSIFSITVAMILLLVFGYRHRILIFTAYFTAAIIVVFGIYLAAHQTQNYSGVGGPFLGFHAVLRYALYNFILFSGNPVNYFELSFNSVANGLIFFPISASLILSMLNLFSNRRTLDARFWILIIGGAAAPTLGFLLLGLITDKGVIGERHFLFASPFLAIILGNFVGMTASKNRYLGIGMMIIIIGIGLARHLEQRFNPALLSRSKIVSVGINSTPRNETLVLLGVNFFRLNWLGSLVYSLDSDVKIKIIEKYEDPSQILEILRHYEHIWVIFVPVRLDNPYDIEMLRSLKEQGDFRLLSKFQSTFHFQYSK